ncbi:uncharacterized protein L3040_003831 [Drepanopeziza brunnea f. sp. 'multigermtubi']|uniref:Uncharacterized protein n=1 Tax=Marssonina brunnea f. sp. multigermtubi (strain MB_m1) TaxID=1072389 RepID=K1WRD5_MARBU|nr:uncharacterized protein MBM_06733 [Drepanopeziza brunnea f. sp. 'multigermtubi' MB_m1]EKD14972.1 hypothetical protein MBM_06733 [Drepanopeziza brunnea f. sp. 'multigermtubi' MB_m1]KAJ5046592.1 hypothetical protein L3040_003831 [Drepanopeziza brunnea f. sp. 'multigermtubi']
MASNSSTSLPGFPFKSPYDKTSESNASTPIPLPDNVATNIKASRTSSTELTDHGPLRYSRTNSVNTIVNVDFDVKFSNVSSPPEVDGPDIAISTWEAPGNDRIFPHFSHGCPNKEAHELGTFCEECRGIGMPWGAELPVYHTEDNLALLHGPPGTLVDHVLLADEEAVAVLSIVASMDVRGRLYSKVDGLPKLMRRFPESVYAGQNIADLHRSLLRVTGPEHELIEAHMIVEETLRDPHLTWETLGNRIYNHMLSVAPVLHYGLSAEEIAAPLIYEERKIPKSKNSKGMWKAPPKTDDDSKWEFCPGSDTSLIIVGKPEPQKFFLIRQKKNNPNIKDCRQYPGWETFDWNDPDLVELMNKARRQILHRTTGGTYPKALIWTQAEKDVLKGLIKVVLDSGVAPKDIKWDPIAEGLFKHFEGKIQPKGSPFAQNQHLNKDGSIEPPRLKFAKKLRQDREGCPNRKGQTVKTQAHKYGDIALMLRMAAPKNQQQASDSDSDDLDDSDDEQPNGATSSKINRAKKNTAKSATAITKVTKQVKKKTVVKMEAHEPDSDIGKIDAPSPRLRGLNKRDRSPGGGASDPDVSGTPRYSKLIRTERH